jgi:hypothetical protein
MLSVPFNPSKHEIHQQCLETQFLPHRKNDAPSLHGSENHVKRINTAYGETAEIF